MLKAGPPAGDHGRSRRTHDLSGRAWLAGLVAGVVGLAAPLVASAPVGAAYGAVVTEAIVGGAPVTLPIPTVGSSLLYDRADLTTFEGTVTSTLVDVDWFEITRDVAGVGPVTLELRAGFPKAMAYGLSAFRGDVDAGGTLTMPPDSEPSLRFQVRGVTYDGSTAAVTCYLPATAVVGSGRAAVDGVSVRHEGVVGSATGTCGGHAPVIEAALAGPAAVELWFAGSHLIASEDVSSQLVVTPLVTSGTVHDRVAVDVAVTYAPAGSVIGAPGTVRVYDDGVLVHSATLGSSGVARLHLDLATPGVRHLDVAYEGRYAGDVGFPLPSSGSFDLDVAPFPSGRAVTGTITVDGVASAVPAGAVWTGGAYDPVSGEIDPGALVSPVGPVTIPEVLLGSDLLVQLRLVQVGEVSGRVRPDGTVELEAVLLQVDARSATFVGDLRACVGTPFPVELQGTADASGLHLAASGLTPGTVPDGSCAGNAANINAALDGAPVDLSFHVSGDFTPPEAIETQLAVQSSFGEVAQFNQTVFSAQVQAVGAGAVAGGTVTFADAGQVLATVPVAGGVAHAVVALPFPGDRVVTATYSGAGLFDGSFSSTAVLVTPTPTGPSPLGGLTVSGWGVGPGAAGVVLDSLGPGGSTSWTPVVLDGEVGGVASTAEVRLIQVGDFTGDASDLQATFVVHVRAVSTGGTTVQPLGCVTVVTVELAADGGGGYTVSSGSSVRWYTGWCRNPLASAWTDALTGPVTGSLTPPP